MEKKSIAGILKLVKLIEDWRRATSNLLFIPSKKRLRFFKLKQEIKDTVMNKKELQKFLDLEQKNWQG